MLIPLKAIDFIRVSFCVFTPATFAGRAPTINVRTPARNVERSHDKRRNDPLAAVKTNNNLLIGSMWPIPEIKLTHTHTHIKSPTRKR